MADRPPSHGGADAERRRLAVREAESLDALIAALGDDSWRVRKLAVDRIAAWPDPAKSARALAEVLAETDEVALRNSAIEALTRTGPPAVAVLTGLLVPEQPHRKFFVDALGALRDLRAVPGLTRCLRDPDVNVRVAAAEALGRIGGTEAEGALLETADTDDMMLQLTALDALAELGAVVPVDRLLPRVDTPVVRVSALRLLGRARDPRALPTLMGALGDKTRRAREAAIESLARYADDASSPDELAVLTSEARALPPPTVNHIAEAVSARRPEVRRGAALLLGLGKHTSAVPELAAGLLDPETGAACSRAIEAMGADAVAAAHHQPAPPPGGRVDMSAEEFTALRDLFYDHCGIVFQRDGAYLLRRRLAPRLNATGAAGFDEYYRKLRFGPDSSAELAAAVDCITTNETYFFREAYQLRALRDEILPKLRAARPRGRRLTIWSAGCSTGEEAYTVAMLVLDAGGFEGWDVRVLGTDISSRVLEVARGGHYGAASVRTGELAELRRFLLPGGAGSFRVRDDVRALVSFHAVNLVDPAQTATVPEADVVLCRNVIMYFDRIARRTAVGAFHDRLAPGGYLLLGHSESLINLTTAFELEQLRNDTVYRKPS